jgi:hypothetical protein
MTDLDPLQRKVRAVIADAVARLDHADLAERIAWNREHGVPGCVSRHEHGCLVLYLGGRPLASLDPNWLGDATDTGLPVPGFIPEAPDTLPPDWA